MSPHGATLPAATEYHRTPMRAFNRIASGIQRLGIGEFKLDENTLIASARKQTGLHAFGDDRFLQPLRVLLNAYQTEANLNPLGRLLARQSLVRILKHRLYAADLLDRHPEILEREIPAPVVVVGLARSGTTRLHRLLACDRRFLHLKAWESVNPVPYPESIAIKEGRAQGIDPRITAIEQGLKAVLWMSPQIATVHPLGAHEIEEEVGLIQHGIASQLFEIQAHMPSFAEWLMTHDQDDAYEYMVTLMKIISWFRDDPHDKPWVLKSPQHMQDLDALMRVFPGARIICSHRDPIKVVGSSCSMAFTSMTRDTDTVDPHYIGNEWLNKIDRMMQKTLAIRDQQIAASQQHDILYADIHRDWQAAIGGIYALMDMEFDDTAKQAMQAWLDSNAQHKHGAHKYDLASFGLDKDRIDQQLAYYRERFDIPYETKSAHQK